MGGKGLKSARHISNIVLHQFMDNVYDYDIKLREFTTFFGQFLDHSIVETSNDMKRKSSAKFIEVPPGDSKCYYSALPFNRNVKANARGRTRGRGWRRAINVLPSAVDLFGVYGLGSLANDLREKAGGRMRTSDDGKNLLPFNDHRINEKDSLKNSPHFERLEDRKKYFIAGDTRSNENPQLTVFHTIFVRHHNFLAAELAKAFPNKRGDDDWLFESARRVNQVHFQAIVYEEYLPVMTGTTLEKCPQTSDGFQCFDQSVDVAISDVFGSAAFRVGHTMVGNLIHRYDENGRSMGHRKLRDSFFPEAAQFVADGVEPYVRGSLRHQAQKIDNKIVEALRNLLFENLNNEQGFDLASINIQRGRDNNLPSFAQLKKRFLGQTVRGFGDITSHKYVQEQLKMAYGQASKVEAFVGLICEDHAPGKPMGPTMIAIWIEEFERLRHGDYYFYQNKNVLPPDLKSFSYLIDIIDGRGEKMRDLVVRHTNIAGKDIPTNVWKF